MNHEEVDVSTKLDKIEEKSTHLSEVADELDVRNYLLRLIC
jgi:hypothetical protein